MLWKTKRTKRAGLARHKKSLRFETLESRQLLTGQVTAALAAQTLTLTGNSSNNQVTVWQGPNVGEIWVEGDNGTVLISGGVPTTSALQFPNVQNLMVNLGPGNDVFQFLAQAKTNPSAGPGTSFANGGTRSELPGNLTIVNGGDDINTLTDVKVNQCFTVNRAADGSSTLSLTNVMVDKQTDINNTNDANNDGPFNGDSNTTIQGSVLREDVNITNGNGDNLTNIAGTTIGVDNDGDTTIVNGDGRERVTFTTYAATQTYSGIGGNVLYGELNVTSGDSQVGLGIDNTVTLTNTQVMASVNLTGGTGDSQTYIGTPAPGSQLGADINAGGPVTIAHTGGYGMLDMENSTAQFGLSFSNGTAGTTDYGSNVKILDSQIGTTPPPYAQDGLTINGDDGNNTVLVQDSQIDNKVQVTLGDGDNNVTFSGTANATRTTMAELDITTGAGEDAITLSKITVIGNTNIETHDASDLINIDYQAAGTATFKLSQLMGTVTVNGGNPTNPVTNTLEYASGQNGLGVYFGSTNFTDVNTKVSP